MMNWLTIEMGLLNAATGAVEFAVNWLLQSTLLIAAGMAVARMMRSYGSAVQSVVYRTTLVAALVCPLATFCLASAGLAGWSVELPSGWSYEKLAPAEFVASEALASEESAASVAATSSPTLAVIGEPAPDVVDQPLAKDKPAETIDMAAASIQSQHVATLTENEPPHAAASTDRVEAETWLFSIHAFGLAAIAAAVAWLAAMAVLATRLALAWRSLGRVRNSSAPAEIATLATCRRVAAKLPVAPPNVLRSPLLPSPCLAGLRDPAILLPADDDDALSNRDVLIHELAHLKRRDCHWNLLRQLATAVFFFQPLLWKLSRLLESTAEEVCDDYVVHFGGDRREYASRLVDIAELSTAPIAAAGVGIVSLRSMLARRVERIMDTSRSLSTRVGNLLLAAVLVGGSVGTIAVGMVGLEPRDLHAVTAPDTESDNYSINSELAGANADVTTAGAATNERGNEESAGHKFAGRVVDPAGKPVAAAELYLVFHIPHPTGLLVPTWKPIARTNASGAFQFTVRPADFGLRATAREFGYGSLVAVKNGFGFAWSQAGIYETSGDWLAKAQARLKDAPANTADRMKQMLAGAGQPMKLVADDQPIRGHIVDINGQPVEGAKLTLLEVWSGAGDDLSAWREAAKQPKADYYSARMHTPRSINGPQVRSLVEPAVTDADGRFTLRGVGQARIAELLVQGPGIETVKLFTRTEAGDAIELPRERQHPYLGNYTYHPAEFMLAAGPSTSIVGTVRDAETNEPLAGVTVKSQERHGEPISGWGQDFVRAVSDEQGRYELLGMPIGDDNRIAAIAPSGDVAYFSVAKRAATGAEKPLSVDFDLRRGVWIEGRVTDKKTGRGLAGRVAYFVQKSSPHFDFAKTLSVDQRDALQSDDQGRFRVPGLPGPGYITFLAHDHQEYPRTSAIAKADGSREKVGRTMLESGPSMLAPMNYHLVAEIDPPTGAKRVELNLELDPGGAVVGRVVDAEGKPINSFYYTGRMAEFDSWKPSASGKFELIGYEPDSPRHVYVINRERNLAGHAIVKSETPKDVIVELQPAGKVSGRLVDDDGAPIANVQLSPWSPRMSSPAQRIKTKRSPPLPQNNSHWQSGQYETDDDGRFEIFCLTPGIEYRIRAYDPGKLGPNVSRGPRVSGPLDVVIEVAPGETKDLGDVGLADEAEFIKAAKQTNTQQTNTQGVTRAAQADAAKGATVVGQVKLTNGKPVAEADVAVVAMNMQPARGGDLSPNGDVLAEGRTDADGKYRLSLRGASSQTHRYAQLIARKPGLAIGWQHPLDLDAKRIDADLELRPEQPITAKLVNLEGQPAAGVELLVQGVVKRSDDGTPSRDGAGVRGGENAPAAWIPSITSNEQGEFTVTGVPEGYGLLLDVVGSDRFAPQDLALNTGMPEQRGKHDGTYRSLVKNVDPGETAVFPLASAQVFNGVITYEDTGAPAPHARVTVWASQQEQFGSMISVAGKADAKGRYLVTAKPGVRFGVIAYAPDGAPYLTRKTDDIHWHDGDRSQEVSVVLPRGVLIRGTVREEKGNAPVADATVQYIPESLNNPNTEEDIITGWQAAELTDAAGNFEIVALPGPGRLLVTGPAEKYIWQEIGDRELYRGEPGGQRNYAHAIQTINPKTNAEPLNLMVTLRTGATVRGRILDENGEPVDEAFVITRLVKMPNSLPWRGHMPPTLGGRFELHGLDDGIEYPVYFLDARGKRGAAVTVRSNAGPIDVTLKPCGSASIRYVDAEGEPDVGSRRGLQLVVTPGPYRYDTNAAQRGELLADSDFASNIDPINYQPSPETDAEGRITYPALIPGATYQQWASADGDDMQTKEFSVEPGEQLDLGEVVIDAEER